jgi:predicted RNA binding protein YcfA (HicA-like mRNA interferase family)
MPSPVPLRDVIKLLKAKGYCLNHVKGSHHIFKNSQGRAVSVPVHRKQVKYVYIKEIEQL